MAFYIESSGLVQTGTTGADKFVVLTGGMPGATLLGLDGADTVLVSGADATATAVKFDMAGGKDVIKLSGSTYTNGSIIGGAGGDTLTAGLLASFSGGFLKAGDGNDSLSVSGNAITGASILLGGGADSIYMSGNTVTALTLGGGAGADTITFGLVTNLATGSEILGGGGADSITLSGGGQGLYINLDSKSNGGGADTIALSAALNGSSTILGKGGADVITLASGFAGASARVEGNAGGDSIHVLGAITGGGHFIGAGSGNDTINITGGTSGGTVTIQGGGGADSITVSGGGATTNKYFGGAGADTIQWGIVSAISGAIAYDALSESTLTTMDYISGGAISGITFNFSGGTVAVTTGNAKVAGTDVTISSNGMVSGSAGSLTAMVADLDSLTTTSQVAVFEYSSNGYMFIQGGAKSGGTSDDLVVKVANTLSGGIAISDEALVLGLDT